MRSGHIGKAIKATLNPVAAQVQALLNAIASPIQAMINTVAKVTGGGGSHNSQQQYGQTQRGSKFHGEVLGWQGCYSHTNAPASPALTATNVTGAGFREGYDAEAALRYQPRLGECG